jgi:ATP-dependent DNA ligase
VTSSFTASARRQLAHELEPLRKDALRGHPWREWAVAGRGIDAHARRPEPLEPGQGPFLGALARGAVCEVKYDHLQGDRFRHAAVFERWRPDKARRTGRYDQLEVTPPAELGEIFGS